MSLSLLLCKACKDDVGYFLKIFDWLQDDIDRVLGRPLCKPFFPKGLKRRRPRKTIESVIFFAGFVNFHQNRLGVLAGNNAKLEQRRRREWRCGTDSNCSRTRLRLKSSKKCYWFKYLPEKKRKTYKGSDIKWSIPNERRRRIDTIR